MRGTATDPPVRAVILLTILMVSVLVGGTVFLLWDLRQREVEHGHAEIASLSRVLAEQTRRTLDGVALSLRGVQDRLSDDVGLHLGLDSFPVLALLKARSDGLPQFSSMFVIDRNGSVANSSLLGRRPNLDEHDRDYFRRHQGGATGVVVSDVYRRRFDGEWTFYVSMRLVDADGNFRGVLAAAVLVNYLESFYRQLELRFGKQIQLIDAHGNLVASFPSRAEAIGRPVPDAPALETLMQAAGRPTIVTPAAGETRGVAYHPVPGYPFLVGVTIDHNEALVSWPVAARPIILGAIAVLGLILAASSGVVWSMRRRAALARDLQRSDERLRQIVESVKDAIVTIDANFLIVMFNPAAETMFGVAADEVRGKPVDRLLADSSGAAYQAIVDAQAGHGEPVPAGSGRTELLGRLADGREFPLDVSFAATHSHGERYLTLVLRDLTERKRIETHLRETNQQLQELTTALQNAREEERAGVAREMHDELGQLLTGIKLELSWLGSRLPGERGDLQRKVDTIKGQLNQTIASVRRITAELRPLILDDLGLRAAISWLTEDFSARTGCAVVLDIGETEPERGSAEATALFRVLQESLTNVTKYAGAATVWIACRQEGEHWRLTVRDDGVGFVVNETKKAGFGLVSMRERIRLLAGTFSLQSAPFEGTTIMVAVPVTVAKDVAATGAAKETGSDSGKVQGTAGR